MMYVCGLTDTKSYGAKSPAGRESLCGSGGAAVGDIGSLTLTNPADGSRTQRKELQPVSLAGVIKGACPHQKHGCRGKECAACQMVREEAHRLLARKIAAEE
eukprot:1145816-Pelagomonas_calceolata.AAC.1